LIRNLLSAFATGLVTFLFLLVWNVTQFVPPITAYAIAGVVGGIGALFWPLVMGFFLVRRAKNRRDEKMQKEIDRQVAEKQNQG
jgi:hypothetical protein